MPRAARETPESACDCRPDPRAPGVRRRQPSGVQTRRRASPLTSRLYEARRCCIDASIRAIAIAQWRGASADRFTRTPAAAVRIDDLLLSAHPIPLELSVVVLRVILQTNQGGGTIHL